MADDVLSRLKAALELVEPVESHATPGPWSSTESIVLVPLPVPKPKDRAFIAAMRPSSDPVYWTKLLKDAAQEIERLQRALRDAEAPLTVRMD